MKTGARLRWTRRHALQRKRACSQTPGTAGQRSECRRNEHHPIQTRLTISSLRSPGDTYEREADRIADRVMRIPERNGLVHEDGGDAVPERGMTPVAQHRTASTTGRYGHGAEPIVQSALHSPGRPLDRPARSLMESRFGHDFSHVRVHQGPEASDSARALDARAYTVGEHIVFAAGEYAPGSPAGRHLLAHELAHTLQQSGTRITGRTNHPGHLVVQRQETRGAKSAAPACSVPSHCPDDFCSPLASASDAQEEREWRWPILRLGISKAVDSRVVPLWDQHVWGGASPQDLSSTFAADFTVSETTALTNADIRASLMLKLRRTPPTFPASGNRVTAPVASLIPREIARLGDTGDSLRMNFNKIGEVPGNIAGDIGKDQLTCKVGAMPSPLADDRTLQGDLIIDLDPATNELTVAPNLNYVVTDTIDLCPGNCGAFHERFATVALSRWEATGISGDVPFTVRYDAGMSPFKVPLSGPPPRAAPSTPAPTTRAVEVCGAKSQAPVVVATNSPGKDRIVKLPEGTRLEVLERTPGRLADGTETVWLRVKMIDGPEPGTIGLVQEQFVENCRMTP